jgi:hypothetical protein
VRHAALIRVILLLLAIPQLFAGAWALVDPKGWYENFPGGGREWLPVFGPYNEHFAIDAGAGLFAVSVLLIAAAVILERRVVQVALIGWLAFAIPHTIYHMVRLDKLDTGDAIANVITLGATVLLPLALLWLTREEEVPHERPVASA